MTTDRVPGGSAGGADRVVRWALGAIGVAGIGYGGLRLLLLAAPTWPERVSAALWLLLPPVLDDLVLLPLVAVVGWLVVRRLPRPWRDAVVVALVLSTFTLAVGLPFLTGYGRVADNPSLLDRSYVVGALVVLGVVWVSCLGAALVLRRRRPSRETPAPRSSP